MESEDESEDALSSEPQEQAKSALEIMMERKRSAGGRPDATAAAKPTTLGFFTSGAFASTASAFKSSSHQESQNADGDGVDVDHFNLHRDKLGATAASIGVKRNESFVERQ